MGKWNIGKNMGKTWKNMGKHGKNRKNNLFYERLSDFLLMCIALILFFLIFDKGDCVKFQQSWHI